MAQCLISLNKERYKKRENEIMTEDEKHTNQAPTAAKLWVTRDSVSADLAGDLVADSDGGCGTSADLEESWPTLAFFFFLSKAGL